MEISSIAGNMYKLDGGAMFGNAPKALWSRWIAPDEQNRIRMATRPLLAVTEREVILFEAGVGAYMEPKMKERFGVDEPGHVLLRSLAEKGLSPEQVTHVFLTHLHFDHAGGLLSAWQEGAEPTLLFPDARYYVSEGAWERATHPLQRDRASFIPELNRQLDESDRLKFLHPEDTFTFDGLRLNFLPSEGHTPGLLCFDLHFGGQRLVYVSDVVPGRAWAHLPISMGYDRYPELLIREKTELLESVEKDNGWLYFVHDPEMAAARVKYDPDRETFNPVEAQQEFTWKSSV